MIRFAILSVGLLLTVPAVAQDPAQPAADPQAFAARRAAAQRSAIAAYARGTAA